MRIRKFGVRLVAFTVFGTGIVVATAFTGAGPAMACGGGPDRSDRLAQSLPQVRYGQRSTYVLGLQTELREHGYRLTGTGYYGPRTLAAVKSYQRRHGIRPSGIVGSKTWHSLVGSQPSEVTGNGSGPPVPQFVVRPGDTDKTHLLYLANVLSRVTNTDLGDWEQKSYSARPQSLVRNFQRKVGIRPSGIVGPKTWSSMYKVTSMTGHWGC